MQRDALHRSALLPQDRDVPPGSLGLTAALMSRAPRSALTLAAIANTLRQTLPPDSPAKRVSW